MTEKTAVKNIDLRAYEVDLPAEARISYSNFLKGIMWIWTKIIGFSTFLGNEVLSFARRMVFVDTVFSGALS